MQHQVTSGNISVTWIQPSNGYIESYILTAVDDLGRVEEISIDRNTTNGEISGLCIGTIYMFNISTVNGDVRGLPTSFIDFTGIYSNHSDVSILKTGVSTVLHYTYRYNEVCSCSRFTIIGLVGVVEGWG